MLDMMGVNKEKENISTIVSSAFKHTYAMHAHLLTHLTLADTFVFLNHSTNHDTLVSTKLSSNY